MESRKLSPERMELYRLDVRNGGREVLLSQKRRKGAGHPIHLMVTKLSDRLFKVEADEPLENGEYALSPEGANQVFCFQIY